MYLGACNWYQDYLAPNPVYPSPRFREVFRIPKSLYHILHDELLEEEPSLQQKTDAFGHMGHTSHQTILMTLRSLATGLSYRQMDDMARMSVESQHQAFMLTFNAIHGRFGPMYWNRMPTECELRATIEQYEACGFPVCMGAIDCMHLHWKNCPLAFKGQYHNPKDGKVTTISCEALCHSSLYCWHWFSGRCGTNNDITVLRHSLLFIDILNGKRRMELPEGYKINGITRQWLFYMLSDGIYPQWCIFAKPNNAPMTESESIYTKTQESVRKDIERFFGVLQGRFRILRHELHEWSDYLIILISQVCVILHNMIIDMWERGELKSEVDEDGDTIDVVSEFAGDTSDVLGSVESGGVIGTSSDEPESTASPFEVLQEKSAIVMSEERHVQLQAELTKHLWSRRGQSNQ